MTYRLINPEPFIIELFCYCGDASSSVWRKDIRELKYPAPEVEFIGPFTMREVCPDSGLSIEKTYT